MIYLNSAKENWVVDRFRKEWYLHNKSISTKLSNNAKILWIISPWTWHKINKNKLNSKKVVCTIHHIDFNKFDSDVEKDFKERDKYVDIYHAISEKTYSQIKDLTQKPIKVIPFWVNQNIWFEIKNKEKLRAKFNIDKSDFLIGNFQRDTEGFDLKSPKLSKGPDQFLKIVLELDKDKKNLHILLAGKRRNYLINELTKNNIKYTYFEMTSFNKLNELYNCLDLYIVASRVEGGPQALFECAITKTPIVSTDVGFAGNILSAESIFDINNFNDAKPNTLEAYEKVQQYMIPEGFHEYKKLFEELIES